MTKVVTNDETPRKAAPRLKIVEGHLSVEAADKAGGHVKVMAAINTADPDFYATLISQLANIATPDEKALNFMMAVIKGIEPRDQLETLLAAQMAAVHSATMTLAKRLTEADTILKQDSASSAFNKLARTFATQMEALKRYRSSGEQTVTVQHVQVNNGGQAIVGNVGVARKSGDQSHAKPATHASEPEMRSPFEADGAAMPKRCNAER